MVRDFDYHYIGRGSPHKVRFNILSFDIANRREDERTIRQAVALINDIITQEITNHGIPTYRIIIGGISQGSALSLMLALTTERPLAGVFVLSGYVPLRKRTKEVRYIFCNFC